MAWCLSGLTLEIKIPLLGWDCLEQLQRSVDFYTGDQTPSELGSDQVTTRESA